MSQSQTPQQNGRPQQTTQNVRHRPAANRMQDYSRSQVLNHPEKYFEELMETEVDENTVALLKNMFNKEMMLGNIKDEDYDEMRILARNFVDFIEAEHPHERSTFKGERRKMLSGDYDNALTPLNGVQKAWIEMAVFNFIAVLSRSRDGFQQEMNVKSINVKEGDAYKRSSSGLSSLVPWR